MLEINPLSVASFANIFSHSEGCLLVLFMVSVLYSFYIHFLGKTSHLRYSKGQVLWIE